MSRYGDAGSENMVSVGSAGAGYDGFSEGSMGGGWATLLCGMAAGAALMYFLDPDRGRRRRALLRDKVVGLSNDLGEAATGKARDLRNRAQGVVAEARGALGLTGEGGEQSGGREGARQRAASA